MEYALVNCNKTEENTKEYAAFPCRMKEAFRGTEFVVSLCGCRQLPGWHPDIRKAGACIRVGSKEIRKGIRLMKQSRKWILSGVMLCMFVLLIILLKSVDVAAVGPEGTVIGLSHVNAAFHDGTGVNMTWYKITQGLGLVTIATAGVFACIGVIQLIQRKSLRKVDPAILRLGALYVLVMILYVFFEKFIVNYRPIVMPGADAPEASFPSTHTMLVCTVMGSTMMAIGQYLPNMKLRTGVRLVCAIIIGVTVVGRLLCGVHWLTDIFGGLLISASLLFMFSAFADRMNTSEQRL